ncbi:MAG: hypothetical protein HQM08_01315 [Candidatus Riflebacteria bacterium]|nr:hypothetical protein [Candidatus Riflebacteria bacterium]
MIPAPRNLTDDEIVKLRSEKMDLNRQARRKTGMKIACQGKMIGYLECETAEGRCPDFPQCHGEKTEIASS